MYAVPFLCLVGILAKSARAIEVVTGSQCFGSCGGGSTFTTDLVCNDDDYASTQYGQKMAGCLSCESTSLAINASMTDEYWFMFNMKYTLQTCVIDSSTKIAAVRACQNDCQPLQPVLDTLWLSTSPYANQYDYCSINSASFPADAPKCAACLHSQQGSVVLGNFVQIMGDACVSQPLAQNGNLVSLSRALLDTSTIAMSTSSSKSSSTDSSSASAGTSTAASVSSSVSSGSSSSSASSTATVGAASSTSTSTSSSSGLGAGAAAGIGIGIGLVAAGAIAGLVFWILRRRKQRRQHGIFAPELPVYSPARPVKSLQEKDAFNPAVSELDHSVAAQELHGHARYEADGSYHGGHGPVELDAGRT